MDLLDIHALVEVLYILNIRLVLANMIVYRRVRICTIAHAYAQNSAPQNS